MLALITATWNSVKTLPATLQSVYNLWQGVKHIFVDGGSDDRTLNLLEEYVSKNANARILMQFQSGLYQALNQGVQAAIYVPDVSDIGMSHSDDLLLPTAFSAYLDQVVDGEADVNYSNIEFHDVNSKRVRFWQSGEFSRLKLRTGWMPPHTSLIVRKAVYETSGLYDPAFGTAADYEWIVRVFSRSEYRFQLVPSSTLSMLVGGASSTSLKARLRANAMDGKVWAGRFRLQAGIVRVCKPLRNIGQYL